MNQPVASLVVRFSVQHRGLVRVVLAELAAGGHSELVLRRGRVTADEARMDVEIRGPRRRLESALLALGRPGVIVHSCSAFDQVSGPAVLDFSATIGMPTLPPASAPCSKAVISVC
jgi:hypothetical protein